MIKFILILFFTVSGFAADTTQLLANLQSIDNTNIAKNFRPSLETIEKFSEIKTLTEKDTALVVSVLKVIALMDPLDKSRTAPQMLAESYSLNKKIYRLAFLKLTSNEQKINSEIFKILDSMYFNGNG